MDNSIILYYMYENEVCAKIIVTPPNVCVENYTDDLVKKPFGLFENPTYEQFKQFLEYRCFPKSRFNCKQLLRDAGLDFYDPYQIVKITHGAMTDDVFWIKFGDENIEWKDVNPRMRGKNGKN